MNCLKASRVKAGTVTAQVDVQFTTQEFQNFSYTYQRSLFVDLTYRQTCRAQAGLGGNEYGEWAVRGLACNRRHFYSGFLNGNFIYLHDYDGNETASYFVGELFGGALLPYFDTPLNAYGRKSKTFYETAEGILELQKRNISGCFIGISGSEIVRSQCTSIFFAVGNGITYSGSGVYTIQNWFVPSEGEPYWIDTNYPFNYQAKRTVENLENYGD
jgi:hypothetical protein